MEDSYQKQQFEARLERIRTREPEPHVATNTGSQNRQASGARGRRVPFACVLAFMTGVLVLLAANVISFQAQGETSFFLKILGTVGPFAIAGALLFVIMIGLGMRDKPHVIGLAAGLVAMYLGEAYLAWLLPDLWMALYSPEHLDNMLIQAGLRTPPIVSY